MWRKLILVLLLSPLLAWAACENTIPASTPAGQLIDNHDGTVSDAKTGLMWKQCSEGLSSGVGLTDCATGTATAYSWNQALQQAQTRNVSGGFAGHTDWRLPNVKELRSLVEEQCYAPAINTAFFPNTPPSYFWSSSPTAGYADGAWGVGFSNGNSGYSNRTNTFQVRLVRGGQ